MKITQYPEDVDFFPYDFSFFFGRAVLTVSADVSDVCPKRQELEQRLASIEKKSDENKQETRGVFNGW